METPTTALAYISGSSPSILQHPPPPLSHPTLSVPSLPPSLLTPHLMRTDERWVEGLVGGLTAVDRKSVMVRKKKTLKIITAPDWSTGLGWGGPLRFRCAQLLILEAERVLTRLKLVPHVSSLFSIGIYMNICIYSCCGVGRERQPLTCSQRALVSMFLSIII